MDEIIQEDCILLELKQDHKEDIVRQLVNFLKEKQCISNAEAFLKIILDREMIFPTSIGKMVAIPHGISKYVKQPKLCIGRLKNPVLWDSEKNEYVIFVILIAVPLQNENNIHIKIISSLMRHLMHDEYVEKLLLSDKQEILQLIKEGLDD